MRRGTAMGLVGLLVGALAACSGSSAPTAVAGPPKPRVTRAPSADLARFYTQKVAWKPCKDRFLCTYIVVPIDYAKPAGATLRIAVNRLPASGRHVGSLLINPGGPGVSGLGYARAARTVVSRAVRERYDVVGFDPRGVGASSGLQCLTDQQLDTFLAVDGTPDTAAEVTDLVAQGRVLGNGCLKAAPALVGHVATREVARDMDVLRAVLGDRKLTYLGKSYGTLIGTTYAGLFPTHVGRMVIDGVLDPASDATAVAQGQTEGFETALRSFLADCLTRPGCPFSGSVDSAESRLGTFLDQLDATPLAGEGGRPVTQSLAQYGVAIALYSKGDWAFLRQALASALSGNGRELLYLADFYTDRGPHGHYTSDATEVIYAVNCLDSALPTDPAAYAAAADVAARTSPVFGRFLAWGNLPCAVWPVKATGRVGPIAAAGAPAILVVGTTRDPATPYRWAVSVARELTSGHLLTYVGDGHTAYRKGSGCIDSAVDAYLLNGTVPADGTRCR